MTLLKSLILVMLRLRTMKLFFSMAALEAVSEVAWDFASKCQRRAVCSKVLLNLCLSDCILEKNFKLFLILSKKD